MLNVQRFSTHDGPGVRTTVFLKGCTNACAWCHNPESMRPAPELQVYPDRCVACGQCLEVCPRGAHRQGDEGRVYDRQLCNACGRCAEECFAGALVLAGRRMTVDEVLAQVLADRPYYGHSGGGLTVSGGEPVLQRAFVAELLRRSRGEGVHTAIETAGNYPWEWLAGLLPHLDLVMYDVKLLDPLRHAEWVGNDGRRARDNLERLARLGLPLIVRTPVVGGVNDTEEEIAAIARLLAGVDGLLYYELLPYHPLGESKRVSLGLAAETRFYTPDRQRLAALAAAARRHLPDVRPGGEAGSRLDDVGSRPAEAGG